MGPNVFKAIWQVLHDMVLPHWGRDPIPMPVNFRPIIRGPSALYAISPEGLKI